MLHAAGVEFEDIRLSVPEEYYKVPLGKSLLTFFTYYLSVSTLILGPLLPSSIF